MPLAAPLADPPPSSRLHRPPRRPPYNLRSVAFSVGTLMWLVTIAHGPHPGTDIVAARVRARTLDLNQLSAPSARWENLTERPQTYAPQNYFGPGMSACHHTAHTRENPKIFRRVYTRAGTLQIYAPGDPPPDFPTHIQYVSTALFCNLGRHPPRVRGGARWADEQRGVVEVV